MQNGPRKKQISSEGSALQLHLLCKEFLWWIYLRSILFIFKGFFFLKSRTLKPYEVNWLQIYLLLPHCDYPLSQNKQFIVEQTIHCPQVFSGTQQRHKVQAGRQKYELITEIHSLSISTCIHVPVATIKQPKLKLIKLWS